MSFAGPDPEGRFQSWAIPARGDQTDWHEGVTNGEKRFAEVIELAAEDEFEAYSAIKQALLAREWSPGWGEENGFADMVARAAIVGLWAMRDEEDPYPPFNVERARTQSLETQLFRAQELIEKLQAAA